MNKKLVGIVLSGSIILSTCMSANANSLNDTISIKSSEIQEQEPNSNLSEAQKIEFDKKIIGSASFTDPDYFKFILPVESTVLFDITSYSAGKGFTLTDQYGKQIGGWSVSNKTIRATEKLKAGTYYLIVQSAWSGDNKYNFTISRNYFKDAQNHWAESQINKFVDLGYIGGYSDGTFRPENPITRAEFVKILNKSFGLTKLSGKLFSDTENHWARKDIDIAVTNGVCNGKSATEFKPDDSITREEAALMIANYKKIKDTNHDKINIFYDNKEVSSWAKDGVEGAIENGYMNGYGEDNTFRPKNNITRAEAVITLSRVN